MKTPEQLAQEYRDESNRLSRFDAAAESIELIAASSIEPEAVRWSWLHWLARGKVHILAGAPGTGKTTLAVALAATITSGTAWPDGSLAEPGNVLFWSGEDSESDVLVPRFVANGGDRDRLHFVGRKVGLAESIAFDPARDMALLLEAARGLSGGVALVVLDPVVSAIAGDSHKNAEVRRGMQPVADLASSLDCALVGITHLSKGTQGREPVERVTGSLAFGAVARVVMLATKNAEADDGSRLLVRAKSNIGPDGDGIAYRLVQEPLANRPHISATAVQWGAVVLGDARSLIGEAEPDADSEGRSALEEAELFLLSALANGPVSAKDLKRDAVDAGIAMRTMQRAKQRLKVVTAKSSFDGGWRWSLPEHQPDAPKVAKAAEHRQSVALATFGTVGNLGRIGDKSEVF